MSLRHGCFKPSHRALPPSTRLPSCLLRAHNHILRHTEATPSSSQPTPITSNATLPPTHISSAPHPAPVSSAPRPSAPSPHYLTIITGASRGLGAAIARVLATHGPPLRPSGTFPDLPHHPHHPLPTATSSGNTLPHHSATPAHATTTMDPPRAFLPSVHHDLVLLASDLTRLQRFVSSELEAALQDQTPPQQQQQGTVPTALAKSGPPQVTDKGEVDHSHENFVDGGVSTASQVLSDIVSNPHGGQLRIRTFCFDLGDLHSLGANIERLLSPVRSASQRTDERRPEPHDHAGFQAQEYGDGGTAVRSMEGGADTSTGGGCGNGGGCLSGVLPLPPNAYAHVLLVHNAGQVGELVPLENQSLENIQRQVDLNITSFAHLTAALLNTFLFAPVAHDDGFRAPPTRHEHQVQQSQAEAASPAQSPPLPVECPEPPLSGPAPGPLTGRGAATTFDGGDACGAASLTAARQYLDGERHGETQEQDPHSEPFRRTITIVNISSVSVDQPYEHFSLYGMGKAARHMLVRSVAHEAALRGEGEQRQDGPAEKHDGPGRRAENGGWTAAGSMSGKEAVAAARVRVLSYAPGALDTEMQAAARQALPAGRLKQRFEDNAASGRLVDPQASAQVLYDILSADTYPNGAHLDYYSVTAGAGASSHPLAA